MARPAAIARPRSEEEVAAVVRAAGERGLGVRAVGAGHSFSACAQTDGVLVQLDALTGIRVVDRAAGLVAVAAGTRLHELFPLLDAEGLALPNQGDIDRQSIAGAVSTGTHGTGLAFTGLAGMVRGMRLVTADGAVRVLGPDSHPEELELARLSLGALGIVTEVTLACVPAFDIEANESGMSFDEAVGGFLERCRENDHTEFYWFPHSEGALVKRNRRLPPGAGMEASDALPLGRVRGWIDDELVGNGLHRAACEVGTMARPLVPAINRLSTALISKRRFRARSHEVFVTPRRTRFHEMEYAVPLEAAPSMAREVRRLIESRGWRIEFPIEVRAAAADDVPLSTAYGRETGYIAMHRFHRMSPIACFRELEAIARAHDGRPHWGKMHFRDRADLELAYPRLAEFASLRDRLDPDRRFRNAYLDRVLGA